LKNLNAKNIVFTIKHINMKEFQFDYILSGCTMFSYISHYFTPFTPFTSSLIFVTPRCRSYSIIV